MGYFKLGVVYWKRCFVRVQHMPRIFVVLVALTSWIASAAAQASTSPPCGGTAVGSGVIQSPNYPRNYPDNARCVWRLLSYPNGTVVRIQFMSFSMENNYDFVTVYDERGISKRYTGNISPSTVLLGREGRIEFYSDGSNSKQGFTAQFVSVNVTTRSQCMTSDTFWCTSDQKCISIAWRCDGIQDCTSREDEYLCPLTTISSTTTLSSQSDCLRYGKFWCSRSAQCVPISDRCDNYNDCTYGEDEANCLTSTLPPCGGTVTGSGNIQSPNYPRNYPDNARCVWRLLSYPNGTSVRIQFWSFNTENNYDFVTVYDERNRMKRYTGYISPFTLLLGREARIEFHSDGSNNMQGFTAQFLSVNVTTRSQCMTSDTFWCTYDQKCISIAWRCDGYQDCSFSEDEILCPSTTISSTTTLSAQSDCLRYGKFWCSRSVKCVPMSYKCDNYNDCTYGEDEAGCSNALQQQCAQMQRFWCGTSRQCINTLWKCDRTNDCTYGEDEQGCFYLSTGAITGIVTGGVFGLVMLILLITGLIRFTTVRRLRRANPTSNNYLQTAVRPSATVYSTSATYASQFGAPNLQAGGPSGSGGLSMDQYAPPSYDVTMKAYATGQYAYPPAQSGAIHPPSSAPSTSAPPTN